MSASPVEAQVRVSMTADRTSVGIDEQLTVRIEVESEGGGSPEVELPGFAGFQVVSQQVQRPMQFSFSFGGRAVVRSSTNYTFGLRPVSVGRLTIDAVRVSVDGKVYASRPIEITVAGGGAVPPSGPTQQPGSASGTPGASGAPAAEGAAIDAMAFLRTVVDKPEPYVGEQVTVTIYLYARQQLRSAPAIVQEPATEGFWTRDLLGPNHNLQPQRQVVSDSAGNQAVYAVYVLRRFAAFPLRDGELAIGPMSLRIDQGSVFDVFAPTRPSALERTGVAVPVRVRALPEEGKPDGDIAVGRFELAATLDRDQVATGDAVMWKATVRGEGNLGGVRVATPAIDGVEVLQPETKDLVEAPQDLVTSTRELAWLLVPKVAGAHTVPPLVLHTFDPRIGRYRTLSTAPLTLVAAGQAVAAAVAPSAAQADAAPETRPQEIEWPPIRARSELRRAQARWIESPGYAVGLAVPPFAWSCLVLVSWARRRGAARAAQPGAIAQREARRHLLAAQDAARRSEAVAFYAEAAAALIGALRTRLGPEVAGLTRTELRTELTRRGAGDEFAAAIVAQLDRWDFARFGATGAAGLTDEEARLRDLFGRIEAIAFDPPEAA
jgi:hypothetical protein